MAKEKVGALFGDLVLCVCISNVLLHPKLWETVKRQLILKVGDFWWSSLGRKAFWYTVKIIFCRGSWSKVVIFKLQFPVRSFLTFKTRVMTLSLARSILLPDASGGNSVAYMPQPAVYHWKLYKVYHRCPMASKFLVSFFPLSLHLPGYCSACMFLGCVAKYWLDNWSGPLWIYQ